VRCVPDAGASAPDGLRVWPVDRRVGSPRNNGQRLLEIISYSAGSDPSVPQLVRAQAFKRAVAGCGGEPVKRHYASVRMRSPAARTSLAARSPRFHPARMFVVSEAEAAAIRTGFDKGGKLAAAVELRRLFPLITGMTDAKSCARTIAG
jgi:hypothetical protein